MNEKNLKEMQIAEEMNLTNNNIFQICRAAIEDNVRKLFVADDINIFGILNRSSGFLTLHTDQKNHLDDDVLDDLAQEVLSRGGEVVLTARQNIPGGRHVLAILQSGQLKVPKFLGAPMLSSELTISGF